jgi:HTH-type transcriptional regulator / antitoxin HigA
MKTVLAKPAEMIAQGAPRVIHNDRELAVYTDALFQLTTLENASHAEAEAIELLTLLVDRYEQSHYSLPKAGAISVLRFLIEQQALLNVIRFRNLGPRARFLCSCEASEGSHLSRYEN